MRHWQRYCVFFTDALRVCAVFASFLLLLSLVSRFAFAGDGSLGDSSTGSSTVSATVNSLVKISGVSDFDFGSYSGSGNFSLSQNLCVWTNVSAATYKVKVRGSGESYAFTVVNAQSATIPFAVKWNNASGTSGNFSLTADQLTDSLANANTNSQSCGGSANANLQIIFTQNDLLSSRPGTYTGVLTVILSP